MGKHILQPRDGVMFANVLANITQKSNDPTNFGRPLEFSQYNCVAFQVWWNGLDGLGIFKLQVSIKSSPTESDWVDKIGGSIETSGASGTSVNVVSNIGEKSLRVIWVPTGVTVGTVSAELMAKDSSGQGNFTKDSPMNVTASFSGLRSGGRVTEVQLNALTWTALPAAALLGRNALCIQNNSGTEIKINYNPAQAGYVGIVIPNSAERQYDITEEVVIYGKASAGTPTVYVEEIA